MTSNNEVNREAFLPKRSVDDRYGVCTRTVDRWEDDDGIGFPKSVEIRKRRYWRLGELIDYERARARAA